MTALSLEDFERIMKQQMETHTQTLKNEIKTMGDEIKANIDCQIAKIHERIDGIQVQVNTQFNAVRADVDRCMEHLDLSDDNNKRITLMNELKLNGINHSNGENLNEFFLSLAKHIGFDTTNPVSLPELTRSFKKHRHSNEFVMLLLIIMKFVAKHIRNKFYALYLSKTSKEPILSEHINLPQGSRILIGEHLTPHNQLIFKEAIKLKRDKKLVKVNTVDGLVFVKANIADKFSCIKTQRDLDNFAAEHSQDTTGDPTKGPPTVPMQLSASTPVQTTLQSQHLIQTNQLVPASTPSIDARIASTSAMNNQTTTIQHITK